jgi:dTDP-4-dehydrorhamnose 3,5-epimerase
MDFKFRQLKIPGVFEFFPSNFSDKRGQLRKTFQSSAFSKIGLCTNWKENFFSHTKENVIRGLHFQAPPSASSKLVYCISGMVFDVVLDLRKSSKFYGMHECVYLNAASNNALYIPIGVAHGFCTLTEPAEIAYLVSEEYDTTTDSGILWDSAAITWPISDPIVSERDTTFFPFNEFISPFD